MVDKKTKGGPPIRFAYTKVLRRGPDTRGAVLRYVRGTHKKQRLSLRRPRGPFVLFLDPSQAPRPLSSQTLHREFGSGVLGLFVLSFGFLQAKVFFKVLGVYVLRASARAEPEHLP